MWYHEKYILFYFTQFFLQKMHWIIFFFFGWREEEDLRSQHQCETMNDCCFQKPQWQGDWTARSRPLSHTSHNTQTPMRYNFLSSLTLYTCDCLWWKKHRRRRISSHSDSSSSRRQRNCEIIPFATANKMLSVCARRTITPYMQTNTHI